MGYGTNQFLFGLESQKRFLKMNNKTFVASIYLKDFYKILL